jgi:hypothetical protein
MILRKTEMRLGDILLENEPWEHATVKHRIIQIGQGLTPNNKGSKDVIHAAVWVQSPKPNATWFQHDIAEASGTGTVRLSLIKYHEGVKWRVYRRTSLFGGMGGNMKVIGREAAAQAVAVQAANIAKRWATYPKPIPYNAKACVQVITHSDSLEDNGEQRAQVYKENAYAPTGVWAKQGFFCSHFVVACFQAAAQVLGHELDGPLFSTDALHCSVRQLENRLRLDSDFQYVGDYTG